MNLKKFISFLMCIVLTFACCSFVYASGVTIKVTISIGQGESKDLSTYMKSDTGDVKWINSNSSVVSVSGKTVKGIKVGSAILKGTSPKGNYQFTVKVLNDYSTPTTVSSTKVTTDVVKNSKGETINYKDYYLNMGVNDTLDISKFVNANLNYYNYSWSVSNEDCLEFKKGKITSKAEGLIKVSASSRTDKDKNTIYRFYVSIDSNTLAKNIIVGKETLTPLATYLGDNVSNYVYTVKSVNGSAVAIENNEYLKSTKSIGTCIVTAENMNGGNNYSFIVRIR